MHLYPRRRNVAAQVAEELKMVTHATPSHGGKQKENSLVQEEGRGGEWNRLDGEKMGFRACWKDVDDSEYESSLQFVLTVKEKDIWPKVLVETRYTCIHIINLFATNLESTVEHC